LENLKLEDEKVVQFLIQKHQKVHNVAISLTLSMGITRM